MFNALVYLAILFLPISLAIGNVAIDSTAVLLDVLFLADVFRRRDFSIFKERWFIAASAFWCYIVLSSYLSIDPKLALKGALPFIRFPLLGLAIFYFLRKDHRILKPLFTISACVVAVLSLNALVQLATGYDLFGHEKLQYAHFWRLTTPYGKQRVGYTCLFLCVPLLGYMFDCI